MQWFKQIALMVVACVLAGGAMAQVNVSGVRHDESIDVQGKSKLQLNGAGVRYRGPFKVYTAGMYLSRKAQTPEEALAAPGAKASASPCCARLIPTRLGKAVSRAMEDNMDKAAFSKLVPGVMRMSQIFFDHKKLVAGDSFLISGSPAPARSSPSGPAPGRAVQGA